MSTDDPTDPTRRPSRPGHGPLEPSVSLERLAAAVPGVLFTFRLRPDGSACLPYASPAVESLFGLRPEELREDAARVWELVHPDDLPDLLASIAESARALTPWSAEFRARPSGRAEVWVAGISEPAREPDGGTLWHGFLSDVTARKAADLRLRESEHRLAETQRIAQLGSWELDHRSGEPRWSAELLRIFELGPPRPEPSYADFLDRIHPEDRDAVQTALRSAVDSGSTFDTTYRIRTPAGGAKWIRSMAETSYDEAGLPIRSIGSAQDVSRTARAETELRKLGVVLGRTPLSVVITDTEGCIEYVNPAFAQVSGYAAEEVLGRNPRILGSGDTPRDVFADLWRTILAGGVWHGELHNRRKSGESFLEEAWISPVIDEEGRTTHFVAIKQDVTERVGLEAQLRQAQKLEALGRLAGGIAHDFNNLLTVISGNGELLAGLLADDETARPLLADVRDAADRAATLTRQLLAFGRRQVLEPRVVDLNDVVRRAESILRRLIGEDIAMSSVLMPSAATVLVDPGQIEQVILNLAVNARDAMPRGGRLTISTREIELDSGYQRGHPYSRIGRHIELAVADTGCGMSEEIRSRIFEPFFTTKEAGKGTGLGLAMVFGCVKQSGGHIEVESSDGQGSTFRIYLPGVSGPESPPSQDEATTPGGGSETILLAEDEPAVRRIARIALERHGYRVIEAGDGRAALEAVERHVGGIDLLVTDVVMPQLGGRELADRLRELCPGIGVLFLSGYIEDEIVREGITASGATFLQKPFSTLDLVRKVRALLNHDG
jgi:PAS domain S-box-containing protein